MRGLYEVFRAIIRLCLWVYYPKTTILNAERLQFKQAAIVVSNHPNTLLDPLFSVMKIHRQSFFLANAGLFKSPVSAWIFNQLYCVPIQRPQDTNGGPLKNDKSFERCENHLLGGGILYVAPEGTSYMNRCLRPLRTGVARIVLGAEQRADFNAGITILPIGLNYEKPNYSGSAVLVNVGEEMEIASWQRDYEQDPIGAVRRLTLALEGRLRDLTLDTLDESEDALVHILEPFLPPAPDPAAKFHQSKTLIARLRRFQATDAEAYEAFVNQVGAYDAQLTQYKLDTPSLQQSSRSPKSMINLVLGLPVFLYGAINHIFAYGIPVFLKQRLKLYIGYDSTVKILAGLVFFPLFYFLQFRLAQNVLAGPWPWVYLLSLPLSAWWARQYRFLARTWIKRQRWFKLQKQDAQMAQSLEFNHKAIQNSIHKLMMA